MYDEVNVLRARAQMGKCRNFSFGSVATFERTTAIHFRPSLSLALSPDCCSGIMFHILKLQSYLASYVIHHCIHVEIMRKFQLKRKRKTKSIDINIHAKRMPPQMHFCDIHIYIYIYAFLFSTKSLPPPPPPFPPLCFYPSLACTLHRGGRRLIRNEAKHPRICSGQCA